MSITKYISTDFGGALADFGDFKDTVSADMRIAPTLRAACVRGDEVRMTFNPPLTAFQESILDEIIANTPYPVATTSLRNFISIYPTACTTSSTTYTRMATLLYPGITGIGAIYTIKCIAHMDAANTEFSVQVRDVTNGKVMATLSSQTNTAEAILTFDEISNCPVSDAIIEFNAKKIGGTESDVCCVKHIMVFYSQD